MVYLKQTKEICLGCVSNTSSAFFRYLDAHSSLLLNNLSVVINSSYVIQPLLNKNIRKDIHDKLREYKKQSQLAYTIANTVVLSYITKANSLKTTPPPTWPQWKTKTLCHCYSHQWCTITTSATPASWRQFFNNDSNDPKRKRCNQKMRHSHSSHRRMPFYFFI